MSDEQPQNPHQEHEAHHDELREVRDFIAQYGKMIVAGFAVALAVVVAFRAFRARSDAKRARAESMLFTAQSLEDLQLVADEYGSTPAAPLALLKSAKAKFNSGDYAAALNDYDTFLDRFATHPLHAAAELGRAHCLEARGQTSEALEACEQFLQTHPDHYLTPQAILAKARCLEQLDRPDEARIVYEDFIVANPGGIWTSRAEDMLDTMDERRKFAKSRPATGSSLMPGSNLGGFAWPEFPATEETNTEAPLEPVPAPPETTNQPAD